MASASLRNPSHTLTIIVWLVTVLIGYGLIHWYTGNERERAMRHWEQQLSIEARNQADDIFGWLNQKYQAAVGASENMSVRLYIMTLLDDKASLASKEAASTFLRNYLVMLADQNQMLSPSSEIDHIRADITSDNAMGMAIITDQTEPMIATRHFPKAFPDLLEDDMPVTGPTTDDIYPNLIWVKSPVYAPQANEETDQPVAWVVGAFPSQPALDELLATSGVISDTTASSQLITWINGAANFVAPKAMRSHPPVPDDAKSIYSLTYDTPQLLMRGDDKDMEASLAIGMPIDYTGWLLVRHISQQAAMQSATSRVYWIIISYWLAVIAITLTVLAMWRHLTTKQLQNLLRDIQSHETLLKLIADHIPARIFMTDAELRVCYANQQLLDHLHTDEDVIHHKRLPQLFGPNLAETYHSACMRAMKRNKHETVLRETNHEHGLDTVLEIQHIPLSKLPERYSAGRPGGVLVIEQDLTEILRAKYAKQTMLNKLIDTLVMFIDQRDPYAGHHSAGVAKIAGEIARAMDLHPVEIETVEIAGRLMNLGKLLVPQDILISEKPLGNKERELIAESIKLAIEYLEPVPFEGPVVDTLRQSQERPDGKGPLGMEQEQILPTALILSVANSFVAMTSPRAYRRRKAIMEVKALMQKEAGSAYAKHVITALHHYLENKGGEDEWEVFINQRT